MKAASTGPAIKSPLEESSGETSLRTRPHPDNPLASTVIRSAEEGRAAVRDQIAHGADWIKLFPTGAYSFTPTGEAQYVADLSVAGLAGDH